MGRGRRGWGGGGELIPERAGPAMDRLNHRRSTASAPGGTVPAVVLTEQTFSLDK